jgi:hypothetical protein
MIAAAPPAVVQIAERFSHQERGVVGYRLHRVFDVHAGPMHRHDELDLAVVSQDGQTIKVRVLRAMSNGKEADDAGKAQLENQYEHPNPDDVFHRPFDPQYLSEYSYEAVDALTYRFTSTMRDGSHGDGTFSTDSAGDVVKYQYTPKVLPRYTTSGTVTYERAQVLPGYWFMTSENHEYRGHYAIFGGGATADITYDSFKRYPDAATAISALQALP